MEIDLTGLWFVFSGGETSLPERAYYGDNAETEARAEAALRNADPPYIGMKLTYHALSFFEALDEVRQQQQNELAPETIPLRRSRR